METKKLKLLMWLKNYFLLLFILFPVVCFAEWTNFVKNYSRNDYKAGSQNWQIIQTDNHWMYFANKTGVLEYNGKIWNHYPLRNNMDVRSLLYSPKTKRIYVGGINETGYLDLSFLGKKQYFPIDFPYNNPELNLGNVWKIYEMDNAVYFCGDRVVLKWLNNQTTPIKAPDKIDCSCLINNTLYIGTTSGIFILAGGAFYRLPDSDLMTHRKLRAILPFDNKVMIATARDGLYLWDENGIKQFVTEADEFIKKNELFSIAMKDNQIAIGTVLKGIVLISKQGKLLKFFNELHGLQNNTILSVFFDINSNLWLGLDNGIDYITLNYSITNLYSAPRFYGAGYTAALHNGKLLLGTNRGLYVTDYPVSISETPSELKFIEGSQGQVWNLFKIDSQLFVCHDRGLFAVDEKGIKSMEFDIGVWEIRQMKQTKDKYWLSTYNGFFIIEKDENHAWKIRPVISSEQTVLNGSTINFEEGNDNTLFVRNKRDELFLVKLNKEQNSIEYERNYGSADVPDDFFIYQLLGKIVLCSPKGFYYFDANQKFVLYDDLNAIFNFSEKNSSFRMVLNTSSAIWALGEDVIAVKYKDLSFTCYHNIPLIANFERIYPISDSTVIIPNENGFALWNTGNSVKSPELSLQITDIKIIKGINTDINFDINTENPAKSISFYNEYADYQYFTSIIEKGQDLKIPYQNNSLLIKYDVISYFHSAKLLFRTQLDNQKWTPFSTSNTTALSDLHIGFHTFKVETKLENGKILQDKFSFTIFPPWYLTNSAYIFYVILLGFMVFILLKLDKIRLKSKERQMKNAQDKELKMKEDEFNTENQKKEQEIIRLTNEKLETEIQHKSQELANSAVILGRKNEVLIEIKNLLSDFFNLKKQDKSLPEINRKIHEINHIIDDNIKEDDLIHKFEENFNLVHNNFIKRLTDQYPNLNFTDRKLCAYLKMQLSSKEIAPLLNISVRGVETMRLRLRKKLGLHNENLSKFLDNY